MEHRRSVASRAAVLQAICVSRPSSLGNYKRNPSFCLLVTCSSWLTALDSPPSASLRPARLQDPQSSWGAKLTPQAALNRVATPRATVEKKPGPLSGERPTQPQRNRFLSPNAMTVAGVGAACQLNSPVSGCLNPGAPRHRAGPANRFCSPIWTLTLRVPWRAKSLNNGLQTTIGNAAVSVVLVSPRPGPSWGVFLGVHSDTYRLPLPVGDGPEPCRCDLQAWTELLTLCHCVLAHHPVRPSSQGGCSCLHIGLSEQRKQPLG